MIHSALLILTGVFEVEDRAPGIPRFASLQDSNDSFCIYRRYGDIVARILIHKEIELERLRTSLHELDDKDTEDPDLKHRLKSCIDENASDTARQTLLLELEEKIDKYCRNIPTQNAREKMLTPEDDLLLKYSQVKAQGEVNPRHHRSIHNYVTKNRSIKRGEEDYLYSIDDFIAVRRQSETRTQRGRRAQDVVEDFVARRPGTWLHVCATALLTPHTNPAELMCSLSGMAQGR